MKRVFKSESIFYSLMIMGCLLAMIGTKTFGQTSRQIDPYLNAGEFAAAISVAKQTTDPAVKDELFSKIASAQRASGLGMASIETISKIDSDLARRIVLRQALPQNFNVGGQAGFGNGGPAPNGPQPGAAGGAAIADFDPLIELIQNTIDPQSWLDTNGGPGTISEFRAGVSVDAGGVLRRTEFKNNNDLLKDIRGDALKKTENGNVFKSSNLRKISLNRLEKECQLLAAEGKEPSEVMQRLAGIYEIKYLLAFPETGDVVIAGPAGEWRTDVEGVAVNTKTGMPLFRLDDLVVCLRNAIDHDGKFGCSIDPRQANFQAVQRFLSSSKLKKKPTNRDNERFLDGLQDAMGFQDISVDGIDPQSVMARVIVEADYRMKLVGMNLEKGVPGAESFMSRIELDTDGNVPPLDLMRLEFMLDYDNVSVTDGKDAYQLNGRGVKVVSANEILDRNGKRIQTGKSTGPAAEFARGFTKHFDDMAAKYPIYRQLKNVFDLAMVTNLITSQGLDKTCKWNMTYFGPDKNGDLAYASKKGNIPKEVKSVMNYRDIPYRKNGRTVNTKRAIGLSGGVSVDVGNFLRSKDAIKKDTYGVLELDRKSAKPASENWWWD